jgi:uncharacterized glyoxalase superfamily protein PhnB
VIGLLVERGARHHIFSAMAVGDLDLIRAVVEREPAAIERRQSRFERRRTAVHFAIDCKRYDILDLLIELGADVDAADGLGRSPMEGAMLRGDREAIERLHAAGATQPNAEPLVDLPARMAKLANSVKKGVPMIYVPDVARALDWYTAIGFKEITRYADGGQVNFGMVSFGGAEVMLNMHGKRGAHDVSLWFYTDAIEEIYSLLKSRQLSSAQAALAGSGGEGGGIEFEQDLEEMFYGARQFAVRDLNGYVLYFIQQLGS